MIQETKISTNLDIPYAFSLHVLVLILHDMQVYYNCVFNEQGRKEIIKAVKCQFRGPRFKTTFL
jgi:isochorismate hydrolase